ncbi:MAG: hypothetical protein [Bacteriophage sp.]|nr:MAG: hypothetical protein [Bacteriophage sp.]
MRNLNFNSDNMLFRCSSLHKLIGTPKNIDEDLLTQEVISAKNTPASKRNQSQKDIIKKALDNSLSATAKTLVKEMVREKVHNAPYKFNGSKETEKGHLVEESAIRFLMQNEFITAEKNTKRFSNEWISGEPDVISNHVVYDTKCPWSYWSMPYFKDDIESKSVDAGYDIQQIGYIWLLNENGYEIKEAQLKYILMPTPDQLLNKKYDDFSAHIDFVNDLPAKDRIKTYKIQYDQSIVDLIKIKITSARKYAKELLEQL